MKTIEELVGILAENLKTTQHAPEKQSQPVPCVKEVLPVKSELGMTLTMAKELAEAVETAAGIMGINVVTAIDDEGANLVLLHAMDNSFIASVRVAQDKAYTAAALKMPTHTALEEARGGALDGLTNGNGIMLLGGGYPLVANGKIYGSIGVSGGSKEQDTTLAAVAAEYFKIRCKGGQKS